MIAPLPRSELTGASIYPCWPCGPVLQRRAQRTVMPLRGRRRRRSGSAPGLCRRRRLGRIVVRHEQRRPWPLPTPGRCLTRPSTARSARRIPWSRPAGIRRRGRTTRSQAVSAASPAPDNQSPPLPARTRPGRRG